MCRLPVKYCRYLSPLILFGVLTISVIQYGQCYKHKSDSISNSDIGSNVTEGEFYNASFRQARRSVVSGGIFSLVSFENVPCNSSSGSDVGVCYSGRECSNLGGTASGPCAGSYGVCCVLTVTCGGTVTINNTYVVNPGYPNPTKGPLSCTITINKLPGAGQLYLEFEDFELLGPTLGTCANDSFTIVASGGTQITYPVLCGNNDGQADYVDLSQVTGPVTIRFVLSSTSDSRAWKIRLVEFKPTDSCAAPSGCFQYYRDISGTIQSPNYNSGQGQMLNNFCYRVCFQNHPGYCNLLLTENSFLLDGTAPNDCMDDYLLINGEKWCGDTLNNGMLQVNQTTGSNFLSFIVCSGATNPDMDLGFELHYNFLPCMTTG